MLTVVKAIILLLTVVICAAGVGYAIFLIVQVIKAVRGRCRHDMHIIEFDDAGYVERCSKCNETEVRSHSPWKPR